jgi:hypothetical protein
LTGIGGYLNARAPPGVQNLNMNHRRNKGVRYYGHGEELRHDRIVEAFSFHRVRDIQRLWDSLKDRLETLPDNVLIATLRQVDNENLPGEGRDYDRAYKCAEMIMDVAPHLANESHPDYRTALLCALDHESIRQRDQASIAKMLLDKGADPNAEAVRPNETILPLGYVLPQVPALAMLLLNAGADPSRRYTETTTYENWTLVQIVSHISLMRLAMAQDCDDVFEEMLRKGADTRVLRIDICTRSNGAVYQKESILLFHYLCYTGALFSISFKKLEYRLALLVGYGAPLEGLNISLYHTNPVSIMQILDYGDETMDEAENFTLLRWMLQAAYHLDRKRLPLSILEEIEAEQSEDSKRVLEQEHQGICRAMLIPRGVEWKEVPTLQTLALAALVKQAVRRQLDAWEALADA